MLKCTRCGASLIELLISLAIIGGLASLILTAAMMLLKAAYRVAEQHRASQAIAAQFGGRIE